MLIPLLAGDSLDTCTIKYSYSTAPSHTAETSTENMELTFLKLNFPFLLEPFSITGDHRMISVPVSECSCN